MIRTGIIGFSEGNGHPFSFSAIVNGYDDQQFAAAGWPVIHNYLKAQPPERFGIGEARVTRAWTQDPELTARICAACRIEHGLRQRRGDARPGRRRDHGARRLGDPRAAGDAVSRAGVCVFVDKPLSLDDRELAAFEPYLRRGKLMSCSGLRFAQELDEFRQPRADWAIGAPKLIEASVLFGIEKYGIHLIEAVASLDPAWGRVAR